MNVPDRTGTVIAHKIISNQDWGQSESKQRNRTVAEAHCLPFLVLRVKYLIDYQLMIIDKYRFLAGYIFGLWLLMSS